MRNEKGENRLVQPEPPQQRKFVDRMYGMAVASGLIASVGGADLLIHNDIAQEKVNRLIQEYSFPRTSEQEVEFRKREVEIFSSQETGLGQKVDVSLLIFGLVGAAISFGAIMKE